MAVKNTARRLFCDIVEPARDRPGAGLTSRERTSSAVLTPFNLRKKFITGLIILIPIVLTVKVLWWLFATVDGFAHPAVEHWAGRPIPGVGFVVTIGIVLLTGLLLSGGPLRRIFEGVADMLETVPFVGSFYATVRKVLLGFGGDGSPKAFQQFVLARL